MKKSREQTETEEAVSDRRTYMDENPMGGKKTSQRNGLWVLYSINGFEEINYQEEIHSSQAVPGRLKS